jgi:8-oxo-dGTP pyrophosphatase MutT (NUDIX family)
MTNAKEIAEPQSIVAASTVVVFRNSTGRRPELLMVRRSKTLSFAASAAVFPGGKIVAADVALAGGDDEQAARIAVVRETLEETGLVIGISEAVSADQAAEARAMLLTNEDFSPVLKRFEWTLDTAQLVAFARWLPNFKPGRIFDTRFYLANIGTGAVALTPDLGENTQVHWISASDALAAIENGELKAIYPTRRNLERLAQFASFNDARDHALATPKETISPWIESSEQGEMLHIPEGLGYPITSAPLSQISVS